MDRVQAEDGHQIQRQRLSPGQPPPGLAPPPGLQKQFGQNTVAPLNNLKGNKPPGMSLGSLASEHMLTQPASELENVMPGSLSAFSLHQVQSSKSDDAVERIREPINSNPSIAFPTKNHLERGGFVPSLAGLTVSPVPNGERSLGSLAANHISGLTNPASYPSLGSLAASHLSTPISNQPALNPFSVTNSEYCSGRGNISNTSSPTLVNLSSSHIQAGSGSSLGSLASNHLSTLPTGKSLGSLAAQHLSDANTSLCSLTSNHSRMNSSEKSKVAQVVDLTSALRSNSLEPATPLPVLTKRMEVAYINNLVY